MSEEMSMNEVVAAFEAGTITDETLVWGDGLDGWAPFGYCRHLFDLPLDTVEVRLSCRSSFCSCVAVWGEGPWRRGCTSGTCRAP